MRPDLFMIVMINKLTNYKFDLKAKTDDEEAVLQGRVFQGVKFIYRVDTLCDLLNLCKYQSKHSRVVR